MYEDYKDDGLMVMMVFEGSDNVSAQSFVEEYDLSFPVLTDVNQEIFPRFDPKRETPFSVIFDEGAVVHDVGVAWYTDYLEGLLGL